MEPVEVTAVFDKNGEIRPLQFTWKEQVYLVDMAGRRWTDERGQHILVMVPGDRVFELVFDPAGPRWYLMNPAARLTVA
jgi:hypothetical protein